MIIATVLLAIVPFSDIAVDTFDLIESNHYHTATEHDDGTITYHYNFTQLICWNFERDGQHHVHAWRMIRDLNNQPQYSHAKQTWTYTFLDSDRMRRIEARCFRNTNTLYDPEIFDKQIFPQCFRSELSK